MSIEFINSQTIKIDGREMVYLRQPIAILKNIEKVLSEIGSEKFFSSPDDEIKKTRESLAGLFFLLALQSLTNESIFMMQPKVDPPDFMLMKLGLDIEKMTLDPFELVEITTRCESFEEMLRIIQRKINKGYSESYHLLIFVNNKNCKEWVNLLNTNLKSYKPFMSVWTLHLLELNNDWWPVANRLRPLPIQHIETRLGDIKLPNNISNFMQEITQDNVKFLTFKSEVVSEFLKKIRKIRIGKM